MKNIFSKLDVGMKFFIIAVFGISCIYFIISNVFKDKEDIERVNIDSIDNYVTIYSETDGQTMFDTSKLVKDYSTFYTIQSALENYFDALLHAKYSATYDILSDQLKEKYTKKEYTQKIKAFTEKNFISNSGSYDTNYCLYKAYSMGEDNMYLCECNVVDSDDKVKIAVKLDFMKLEYIIVYIEF